VKYISGNGSAQEFPLISCALQVSRRSVTKGGTEGESPLLEKFLPPTWKKVLEIV